MGIIVDMGRRPGIGDWWEGFNNRHNETALHNIGVYMYTHISYIGMRDIVGSVRHPCLSNFKLS